MFFNPMFVRHQNSANVNWRQN